MDRVKQAYGFAKICEMFAMTEGIHKVKAMLTTTHPSIFPDFRILNQGFSYLSKSGSRGRLIWEKSSIKFKIGKNGLEKLNSLILL